MNKTKIFQIYYDESSRRKLDPGFIPLDNSCSPDADWHEFWPILNYLNTHELEDDVWYGFLSPKFTKKFNCSSAYVYGFLNRIPAGTEVALFSPGWDQLCYFKNPWEQGEIWHPGVTNITQRFLASVGETADITQLVTDVTSSVFSNYILAKKSYWLEWMRISNQLAKFIDENQELSQLLTVYGNLNNKKQIKTFVQERMASYLLATRDFKTAASTRSKSFPIFKNIFPESELIRKPLELCDHFKRKYRSTKDQTYLKAYADTKNLIKFKNPYQKLNLNNSSF